MGLARATRRGNPRGCPHFNSGPWPGPAFVFVIVKLDFVPPALEAREGTAWTPGHGEQSFSDSEVRASRGVLVSHPLWVE